jgi:hypothetical protein
VFSKIDPAPSGSKTKCPFAGKRMCRDRWRKFPRSCDKVPTLWEVVGTLWGPLLDTGGTAKGRCLLTIWLRIAVPALSRAYVKCRELTSVSLFTSKAPLLRCLLPSTLPSRSSRTYPGRSAQRQYIVCCAALGGYNTTQSGPR